MSDRASLLEILRLLAAAGYIDDKVFLRDDGAGAEVQAHAQAVDVHEPHRRRHLVSV
jgi:hypothetical protein